MTLLIDQKDERYVPKWPRLPWPDGWDKYRPAREREDVEALLQRFERLWACSHLTNLERGHLLNTARAIFCGTRPLSINDPNYGLASAFMRKQLAVFFALETRCSKPDQKLPHPASAISDEDLI
ncbi:MAG TPA: hypothetical protein VM659_00970 [Dongiaceae bacterium]|nr:hypothetical protein [Dongiaceae bacterium]